MPYTHLFTRLIRGLEEDTVVTNPRDRGRALLRKLTYRSLARLHGILRRLRGLQKKKQMRYK